MKKFILLTIVFCLVLTALVACSKEEEPLEVPATETEEAETTKIPDKYDKYRGDNGKTEDKTPSGGETPITPPPTTPTPTTPTPEVKKEGFGVEVDWEEGTTANS